MKKRFRAVLLSLGLLFLLAQPAFAAELGEPNITPQTTMRELRENPSLKASGYYTYCREMLPIESNYWNNKTLAQYAKPQLVYDCADAMNLVIENYNKGVQVTWQVYTPEEIAENSSLGMVQLFYYPAEGSGGRYAIVLPGNGSTITSEMEEGGSAASQLHAMGYTVFVLRYRSFLDATDNAPLDDIGRAVQFITQNAERFGVQAEGYAITAFSSGGQLAGLFCNEEIGWGRYRVPKPGALLMAYPVINFNEIKLLYHVLMDPGECGWRFYCSSVADVVTDDYPPVYFWYGKNDIVLPLMDLRKQGPAFEKALQAHSVPYLMHVYKNAGHSIGTGCGTDAEGWLTEAAAFWEEQVG